VGLMKKETILKGFGLGLAIFVAVRILTFVIERFFISTMGGIQGLPAVKYPLLYMSWFLRPISIFSVIFTETLRHSMTYADRTLILLADLLVWIPIAFLILMPENKKKSVAILVVGIFCILNGIMWAPQLWLISVSRSLLEKAVLLHSFFTTLSGIVSIICGAGLLLLRRWAWVSTLILIFVSIGYGVGLAWYYYPLRAHAHVLKGMTAHTFYYYALLQIAFYVVLCIILMRPRIKAQFK
jgi:hypothetical protein